MKISSSHLYSTRNNLHPAEKSSRNLSVPATSIPSALYRILALAFIVLLPLTALPQNSTKFKRFSLDQGLSMNDIRSIAQDKKGFVWIGTLDGLNRFDGYNFHVYKNNPNDVTSLSNNTIWALLQGKNGELYIGTDNGGLNVYDYENDSFIHYQHDPEDKNSIGADEVSALFEDAGGTLWVGTDGGGLNLFDRNTKKFTRYLHNPRDPNSILSNIVKTIAEDKNGDLWIGTVAGISVLNKERNKFTHYQHKPEIPGSIGSNDILKIFIDSNNEKWVATTFGLYLYNDSNKSFKAYLPEPGAPTHILGSYVPDVTENDGSIWIATNMGLNILDKKTNTITYHQNDPLNPLSLVDNGMNTLYRDSMGNVWLGTYAGLSMKEAGRANFLHYTHEPTNPSSLTMKEVISMYQGKNGKIWIGNRMGFHEFDQQRNEFYHHNPFEESDINKEVSAFYEDSRNNFWLGSPAGLYLYNPAKGTVEKFHESNPGGSNNFKVDVVWHIQEDLNNEIWISSLPKGIFKLNRKTKQFFPLEWEGKYIPNKDIFSFYIDKDGTFWIGTALEGLFKINKEKGIYEVYRADKRSKSSISSNFILKTFEDSKGNFWVGTRGGLNLMNRENNTFTSYTELDGLPNGMINSILEDNEGNLWLGTNKGISRFNPETKAFKNYNIDHGLQHNEFWHRSAVKLDNGDLLFGGINGFNLFNPNSLTGNEVRPPVFLSGFQIFNKPVEIGKENSPLQKHISETKEIVLSYKESVFSFDFVALNYIISKNNKYAFMLEGFDKNWNYVDSQRKATYTNINPGEYTFRVKASNNDGLWNEEGTAIKLIITPPFWETWWFRVLAALSVIGCAITFFKVRMNAVKAQKEKLERQVKEKTADLVKANDELTERQEEVMQQQEELQAQADMLLRTNDNLRNSEQEISRQRDNLEKINEQVMSSIQYAQTIQKAILPSVQKIEQVFPEHFILYRPKDVVSGDFYWFTHLPKEESGLAADISFMAVVDCTGHGVPGAFMSIIGSTILNEIVKQKQITDPASILELLNEGIKQAVEKTEGMNTAGMDVCLCQFEKGEGNEVKVLFSGAKRNLLFVRPGTNKIEKLLADRRSIGSSSNIAFTTQELVLECGSMLYLTSDGYADQNNPAREKLGGIKLHETIKMASQLAPADQKKLFDSVLDDHQKDSDQRDDITLVGLKL